MDRYRELIKENIDYDLLLTEHPYDEETLEGYGYLNRKRKDKAHRALSFRFISRRIIRKLLHRPKPGLHDADLPC